MPRSGRLDKVYARCMANQPFGHALYKPVSSTDLRPGVCGYFDIDGDWKKIADLRDTTGLADAGYTTVESKDLEALSTPESGWGVRHSSDTRRFNPNINLSANIPGAPAGGTINLGYKTASDIGAVLVAEGEITHDQLGPTSQLCNWMVENANKILYNKPDARKKGIWIVTKTYTAKRRALTLISDTESGVTVELSASAFDIGEVGISNEWWHGHKDSGWGLQSDSKGVVLFMSGIQWRPRWYRQTTKPEARRREQQWLGSNDPDIKLDNIVVQAESEPTEKREIRKLVPKVVGQLPNVKIMDETGDTGDSKTYDFFNDVDSSGSDSDSSD